MPIPDFQGVADKKRPVEALSGFRIFVPVAIYGKNIVIRQRHPFIRFPFNRIPYGVLQRHYRGITQRGHGGGGEDPVDSFYVLHVRQYVADTPGRRLRAAVSLNLADATIAGIHLSLSPEIPGFERFFYRQQRTVMIPAAGNFQQAVVTE